ncbi:neurensin-2 [Balearica regulorum gibbericeps]|uniref:neurensin-2 n=1 Tax=Balearica regulorum gibbericeps TaxID=100784 RepID=UPI003F5D9D2F
MRGASSTSVLSPALHPRVRVGADSPAGAVAAGGEWLWVPGSCHPPSGPACPLCPPGPMPAHQPDCSCVHGSRVVQGKWYGVRSYLHLFYEDCTGASPDGDRSPMEPGHPSSGRGVHPATASEWPCPTGTLFLLVGATMLAASSLVPPKLEGIGEEGFVVLDVQTLRYSHTLGTCRLVGMVLCVAAGALGAVRLLARVLALCHPQEEEQQPSPILSGSPPPQPPRRLRFGRDGKDTLAPWGAAASQREGPHCSTRPCSGTSITLGAETTWSPQGHHCC